MIKKSVCVPPFKAFLVALVIAFGGISYSPPAHAIGLSIVHDPTSLAKNLVEWAKNYAMQKVLNNNVIAGALNIMGVNTKGFQATIDNQKSLAEKEALNAQTIAMQQAVHEGNLVDKASEDARKLAAAEKTADIKREAISNAESMCIAATQRAAGDEGGAVGESATTPRARAKIVLNRLKASEKDPAKQPRASEVASEAAGLADDETGGSNANAFGSPGGQGPATQYRDQSKLHLKTYASPEDGLGAAKALVTDKSPERLAKVNLDTRAGDLMTRSIRGLHLLCFKNEMKGGKPDVLGGALSMFCPTDASWESFYVNGDGKSMVKPIDVSTGIVIRDYIVPAPLSPMKPAVYAAIDKGNQEAVEVFAKRQAYNNLRSVAASHFNWRIAERLPQKMGDETLKNFTKYWEAVYGQGSKPPTNASFKLRNDIRYRYYDSPQFVKDLSIFNPMTSMAEAAGTQIGLQKDILYTLERIETLLTIQLANDLVDRRDGVERRVTSLNNSIK